MNPEITENIKMTIKNENIIDIFDKKIQTLNINNKNIIAQNKLSIYKLTVLKCIVSKINNENELDKPMRFLIPEDYTFETIETILEDLLSVNLINLKFIKHEISCNDSFDLFILNVDEFIEYLKKEQLNTTSKLPLLKVNENLEKEKFNNITGYNILRKLDGLKPIEYSN